jgi:hypothetical protein
VPLAPPAPVFVFARFPDFHGNTLDDGTKVLYRRSDVRGTVLIASRAGGTFEVYRAPDAPPEPLVGELALDGVKIGIADWFAASRVEERLVAVQPGGGPPAYCVSLEGASAGVWLCEGHGEARSADGTWAATVRTSYPLGFSVTLDDAVAEHWPNSSIPRAYYSHVRVGGADAPLSRVRIETNAPLVRGGFRLYQSSMDPEPPFRWSGFAVAHDPGIPVVAAGFLIMSAGLLWLYVTRFILRPLARGAPAAKEGQ